MPTVLFDLDDTLLDHDSFTRFLNRLLRRNPVRLIAAAVLLPFVALLLARPRWKLRGASLLLWVATVGIRQTSFDAIVDRYVTDMRVRERLRQAGAEALDRHIQQGDTVVVVTASADLLALRLCVDSIRESRSLHRLSGDGLVASCRVGTAMAAERSKCLSSEDWRTRSWRHTAIVSRTPPCWISRVKHS